MSSFQHDQPKEGAEILLRMAKHAVEYRHGSPLPKDLTEATLAEFIERFEFAGSRFQTALHFGLAAVVAQEHPNEKGLVESLSRSLGDRPVFPIRWDGIDLIALGIILEPRVVTWLERESSFEPAAFDALAKKVIASRQSESVNALIAFAQKTDQYDRLKKMAKLCAMAGLTESSLEILCALPGEALDEKTLADFVSYRLTHLTPEQIESFSEKFLERILSKYPKLDLDTATAESLLKAGRIDEAEAILDRLPDKDRWRYYSVSDHPGVTEMKRGRFEKGLAYFERFSGGGHSGDEFGAKWITQFLDQYDLDQAISMSLRLPHNEKRSELAAFLVARGEISRAEEIAEKDESALRKVATLIAMAKEARAIPDLRERAGEWLAIAEDTLEDIPLMESPDAEFRYGKTYLARKHRVEQWHRGDRDPLERFLSETLARRDQLLSDRDSDDADLLTAMAGLALAETRWFERLMPMLRQLGQRDDVGNVTEAIFENWDPETDCDEILPLCRDREDNDQRKFLVSMARQLAEINRVDRAEAVAQQLRDVFEDEDGFEAVAEVLRDRGDYDAARELGGAPGRYGYEIHYEPKEFSIGPDDEEAREWVTSVKGWDDNTNWLLRYGCHGRAREAVEGLIRFHLHRHLPRWLTDSDREPDPDFPQDFPGICRRAQEEAKYRVWLEGKGPAPRTPLDTNLMIWKIEAMSWFLDIFAGTRINAWEKKINREMKQDVEAARQTLKRDVPKALELPPGEERYRTLCDLGDRVSRYDDLTAPDSLITALREEAAVLRNRMGNEGPEDTGQLNRLAVVMLGAGDAAGAAEAWSELSNWSEIEEYRIRDLAKAVRREDWNLIAPLCHSSPLACAVLAAKLARWFPKAGIRIE